MPRETLSPSRMKLCRGCSAKKGATAMLTTEQIEAIAPGETRVRDRHGTIWLVRGIRSWRRDRLLDVQCELPANVVSDDNHELWLGVGATTSLNASTKGLEVVR